MNESSSELYSTLGGDPDLGELVEMFVDEMPGRIQKLQTQGSERNWEALAVSAHQLKGAAGSYGFDQVSPYAADLESAARNPDSEDRILNSLDQLVDLCSRLRAGIP